MSLSQSLVAGHGMPLLVVDGAEFDGTNDYMLRGADLSGNADSKTGILSAWFRQDVSFKVFLQNATARVSFEFINGDSSLVIVTLKDTAGTNALVMNSTATVALPASTWHHALISWDLAAGATHLYLDDASSKGVTTGPIDANIDYTDTNWAVGATTGGLTKYDGGLAELYFAPGQYLDFSSVVNRRKFISAGLKPVYLGATGSLPTGTAPLIYHHLDNGEAVANFATNRGTGGNFTITGTLVTSSTSPSD